MFFVASCRAWPWSESGPHPAANAASTSTTSAPSSTLTLLTSLTRASSSLSPLGCRIFLGSRFFDPYLSRACALHRRVSSRTPRSAPWGACHRTRHGASHVPILVDKDEPG